MANCHLPFAICHLPFAICHLPSANCHLPSANCHLPIATCYLLTPNLAGQPAQEILHNLLDSSPFIREYFA
jgi:hypothetical protein